MNIPQIFLSVIISLTFFIIFSVEFFVLYIIVTKIIDYLQNEFKKDVK